jgi:hypothetical protein
VRDESTQGDVEEDGGCTGEERDSNGDHHGSTDKFRRSTAINVTAMNDRGQGSHPTIDGHPLKPWMSSLRKNSGSAGEMHEPPRNGARIRGEPLRAMRARWSSVPSRVREDVRKDRKKWLDQQARGEHVGTMPHVIVAGGDDSARHILPADKNEAEPTDTTGANRDTPNFQDEKEAGWLGFDDAIVNHQCQRQTRRDMVDQLSDDRLSRYFDDAETTQATSPLDRHLGAQASSYYKPELRGASAATPDAGELQSSPDSQKCVPLASLLSCRFPPNAMATSPFSKRVAFHPHSVIPTYSCRVEERSWDSLPSTAPTETDPGLGMAEFEARERAAVSSASRMGM